MTKRTGRSKLQARPRPSGEQVPSGRPSNLRNGPRPPGGPGADELPTTWEQEISNAAIGMTGMLFNHQATGNVAFALEEAEVVKTSMALVAHDDEERADFVAQAMSLAKDMVRGTQAEVAAFRAGNTGARLIFGALDQIPVELLGKPLWMPHQAEDPRYAAPDRLTEHEWRSLHLAAHAKVGVTLIQVPVVASFRRFRFGIPGTIYPFDARLRTLAAGDALDFLVMDRLSHDLDAEARECHCRAIALSEIDHALSGTVDSFATPARDEAPSELHNQHMAETMPIVRAALESGELDAIAGQIRRLGRIQLEPEVTPRGT
jgi:hypothetical protein